MVSEISPVCSRTFGQLVVGRSKNGELEFFQVLLMVQIPVSGDEQVKVSIGFREQIAVFQFGPTHLKGSFHFVTWK